MARFEHTCPPIHLSTWMDTLSHGSRKPKRRLVELRGKRFTVKEDEDVTLNEGSVSRGSESTLEIILFVKKKQISLYPEDEEELKKWMEGLTYAFAKLEDYYEKGREIGRGAFSKVYLGRHIKTKRICAIKIVNREGAENMQLTARETSILATCTHENIIWTYDIFVGRKEVAFVMEHLRGGELYDRIADAKFFSEENARDAIRDVLRGVEYLHSCGIAHRDLKPENLLCVSKEFPLQVKVSDFGLSNFLDSDKESRMMRTVCGSLNYIAPEMMRAEGYGPEAGVQFDEEIWRSKSKEGRDLVRQLLEVDPKHRPSATECLRHPWFLPTTKISQVSLRDLNTIRLLKSYRGVSTSTNYGIPPVASNPRVRLPKKGATVAVKPSSPE